MVLKLFVNYLYLVVTLFEATELDDNGSRWILYLQDLRRASIRKSAFSKMHLELVRVLCSGIGLFRVSEADLGVRSCLSCFFGSGSAGVLMQQCQCTVISILASAYCLSDNQWVLWVQRFLWDIWA